MNNIGLEAFFEEAELVGHSRKVAKLAQDYCSWSVSARRSFRLSRTSLSYADLARWRYKAAAPK